MEHLHPHPWHNSLSLLMDHRPWQMAEVEVDLAQSEPFTLLGSHVLLPVNINVLQKIFGFMSAVV